MITRSTMQDSESASARRIYESIMKTGKVTPHQVEALSFYMQGRDAQDASGVSSQDYQVYKDIQRIVLGAQRSRNMQACGIGSAA